ncbi:MAG: formylglycine-generating enzyme family protein [Rubrivivax sp.]|nr:formylglycine-generating enzyme family protein [Rubrivivax sp.]
MAERSAVAERPTLQPRKGSVLLGPPLPEAQRIPSAFPPPWAVSWGDDKYGLWAELEVRDVVQRLRWIEPGTFLMGSPDDEPGRWGDEGLQHPVHRAPLFSFDKLRQVFVEGPQHPVRLTRGFWLADTACTQALWLAVMGGDNPSRFKEDPQCPVEEVVWDQARSFLETLTESWAEGDQATLPTEAEWEYACRAGSPHAFAFGAEISTDDVNFSGKFDHDDKDPTLGTPRKRTVPVKSFPANRWGLFEMHGNVWEWCADGGPRAYATLGPGEVAEDPLSAPAEGYMAHCAQRGGSWSADARDCRSASRHGLGRGFPIHGVGFRLALRSSSSSSSPAR